MTYKRLPGRRLRMGEARPGVFFVTISVQKQRRFFGRLEDGRLKESPAGSMVREVWSGLESFAKGFSLDEFIVMPDHFHAVVILGHPFPGVGKPLVSDELPVLTALDEVVHRFKSYTTHLYLKGVREQGWPRCSGKLWQRSFHRTEIYSSYSLDAVRAYIRANPRCAKKKSVGR
ncbi:MAG: transposase [Myxococcales bacterium]|nr:transposase [Myxococcales bacterium]MCB9644961.1 transposase [Myxococcales bacterium]